MNKTAVTQEHDVLLALYWSDGKLGLELAGWAILLTVAGLLGLFLWRLAAPRMRGRSFEIDQAELGLGDQKITLRPNYLDRTVAYKIWVELSTRKVGLPIDTEDDVIAEIYDSWFAFFQITRDLIKDVPVSKIREPSTEKIIQLSIDLLNNGLRPHLTKWQARFRRWYEFQLSEAGNADLHPQDIQAKFPAYAELSRELLEVNARLMTYRERMRALIVAR